MTITPDVKRQLFAHDGETNQVIRLPPSEVASPVGPNRRVGKPWTKEEHERFLEGLQMYPNGPWRRIATHVGTRTSRQTMTHAQKYRERISRMLLQPGDTLSSLPRRRPQSGPVMTTPSVIPEHQFDELDLEILSSLLGDSDNISDDSSASDNQDDFFGDLLGDAGNDREMMRLLSELEVNDHAMPLALKLPHQFVLDSEIRCKMSMNCTRESAGRNPKY